jgi:hypothetical protein
MLGLELDIDRRVVEGLLKGGEGENLSRLALDVEGPCADCRKYRLDEARTDDKVIKSWHGHHRPP